MNKRQAQTIAAANGIASDTAHGAVTPPLHLSTTFTFDGFEGKRKFDYSRTDNPSRNLLAETIAKLEGGAGAVVTASGMSAVDLVLSRLRRDDMVLVPHDCYGGTHRLLAERHERGHFRCRFVDQGDPAALDAAFAEKPALVMVETPSNPLMRIVDIRAMVARAKAAGAKVSVDNTFLSPARQRPLALGADFVIHSTTKYLNGHSDVVGGAVVAADQSDVDVLLAWANITGVTGAPFDSYMTLRGLRTLFPRMDRQEANAMAVAMYLASHPAVASVHYPGLASHPGHALARTQQSGFGAMLSVELAGGVGAVRRFVAALQVFTLAESLGGVETLVAHPATMTHASMSPEARRVAGIGDGLLRLSIGLEAEADLVADLDQAFSVCG